MTFRALQPLWRIKKAIKGGSRLQEQHWRKALVNSSILESWGRMIPLVYWSSQLVKGIGVFGGHYNLEDATTGLFEPSDLAVKQSKAPA